jgi:hypothetical protein
MGSGSILLESERENGEEDTDSVFREPEASH